MVGPAGRHLKIFRECKDAPVTHWGFKDVGLPPEEMKGLVQEMKAAGITTYLEVVSLSEEEGLHGTRIAVEPGFDILEEVVAHSRFPESRGVPGMDLLRMAEVWQAGAWGFTIGSALFDKKFVPEGTFLENTLAVCNWLANTDESERPEVGRRSIFLSGLSYQA